MKKMLLSSLLLITSSAWAGATLDCTMKQNVCGMSGVSITLPWEENQIPNPTQVAQRSQIQTYFDIAYGYDQATGSGEEGNLIIRDQDAQMGPYWGLVGRDQKYFAMIAGNRFQGFKVGVKGCLDAPRVWSASCKIVDPNTYYNQGAAQVDPVPQAPAFPTPPPRAQVNNVANHCFIRVPGIPYYYYEFQTTGPGTASLDFKYYQGGGDGYSLTITGQPGPNTLVYSDAIFGYAMVVENRGSYQVVDILNGTQTVLSQTVCTAQLDESGMRRPTQEEAP